MTGTEKVKLDFMSKFNTVKKRNGWTNRDIAKLLKVSTRTVTNIYNDPFATSGRNIMTILALYEEAMSR